MYILSKTGQNVAKTQLEADNNKNGLGKTKNARVIVTWIGKIPVNLC